MDDFAFEVSNETTKFVVVMDGGKLTINGSEYEENPDDPTYALCREIALLKQEI